MNTLSMCVLTFYFDLLFNRSKSFIINYYLSAENINSIIRLTFLKVLPHHTILEEQSFLGVAAPKDLDWFPPGSTLGCLPFSQHIRDCSWVYCINLSTPFTVVEMGPGRARARGGPEKALPTLAFMGLWGFSMLHLEFCIYAQHRCPPTSGILTVDLGSGTAWATQTPLFITSQVVVQKKSGSGPSEPASYFPLWLHKCTLGSPTCLVQKQTSFSCSM